MATIEKVFGSSIKYLQLQRLDVDSSDRLVTNTNANITDFEIELKTTRFQEFEAIAACLSLLKFCQLQYF